MGGVTQFLSLVPTECQAYFGKRLKGNVYGYENTEEWTEKGRSEVCVCVAQTSYLHKALHHTRLCCFLCTSQHLSLSVICEETDAAYTT